MRKQLIQKGDHSVGGFLCRRALEQIIGAQHHQENIHRCVLGEQSECIGIAWNLPAVGTGIDPFVTSLLCQQVNPAIFCAITVTEESSGIVPIGVGIPKTQNSHRNHLRWIHYSTASQKGKGGELLVQLSATFYFSSSANCIPTCTPWIKPERSWSRHRVQTGYTI